MSTGRDWRHKTWKYSSNDLAIGSLDLSLLQAQADVFSDAGLFDGRLDVSRMVYVR